VLNENKRLAGHKRPASFNTIAPDGSMRLLGSILSNSIAIEQTLDRVRILGPRGHLLKMIL
jgi:hypothetical protein